MTDLSGLRIGLLTASASRLGGGVFEAVAAQAAMIRDCGGEAPVFALHDAHSDSDSARFADGTVSHVRVSGPARFGFAPGLIDRLVGAGLDCLHLHGIWMYPSRAARVWARRTGGPLLISPHGMLAPWIVARGRLQKSVARIAYERASWREARAFHALTEAEAADILRESGRYDALVIPNAAPRVGTAREGTPSPDILYIGRVHPKKNLAVLIAAWSRCREIVERTGARLRIAGWGEDAHVAELRRSLADGSQGIEFVGPSFGADKQRLLAAAGFVVLPSLSEGLPMAILEAWAAGTPTLMSRECNLGAGFAAGAAIDCGTGEQEIAAALEQALSMPHDRWRAMSGAARALAAGPFAAETVARHWAHSYRDLIAGESPGAAA